MFTEEEKKELINTAAKMPKNDLWQKAFMFYNEKNKKQLSMQCRPCYFKVILFIM